MMLTIFGDYSSMAAQASHCMHSVSDLAGMLKKKRVCILKDHFYYYYYYYLERFCKVLPLIVKAWVPTVNYNLW
jgi:hypothetical protein